MKPQSFHKKHFEILTHHISQFISCRQNYTQRKIWYCNKYMDLILYYHKQLKQNQVHNLQELLITKMCKYSGLKNEFRQVWPNFPLTIILPALIKVSLDPLD